MTMYLKSLKKNAESLRMQLINDKLYLYDVIPEHDKQYVYFPVNDSKASKYGSVVQKTPRLYQKKTQSLKKILSDMNLDTKQIDAITSYDTVGEIAILKITKDIEPYEKEIAKALLEANKSLKTIVKKTKEHHGVYRVQSVKYLAGKRNFTTYAKEAGAVFKVRVGDMFFSPRLSFERIRIANMVKPNSNVAVFFSGVAPFSIIIAKLQPNVNKIISIELNPKAHKNAIENIEINRMKSKVEAVCADVRKYAKEVKDWADYVIMPLPKTSDDFLDAAFTAVKKYQDGNTGVISLYKFVPTKDPYKEIIEELEAFAHSKSMKLDILFKRQVRDYSFDIEQIVVDFRLIKE